METNQDITQSLEVQNALLKIANIQLEAKNSKLLEDYQAERKTVLKLYAELREMNKEIETLKNRLSEVEEEEEEEEEEDKCEPHYPTQTHSRFYLGLLKKSN